MQVNEVDFEAFQKAVKPVQDEILHRLGHEMVKQVLETK